MIKRKTFYGSIYSPNSQEEFDNKINVFMEELSNNESIIINYNTFSYSQSGSSGFYYIRTEIVYREIPTRKVITEKVEHAQN